LIDLPLAFLTVARQIKDGTFKPGVIELGEPSRVVMLVMNPAIEGQIPPAARARVDSLQAKMLAGEYTVLPARDSSRAPR
jgi:basic membrane lipoprotein Med (substrate-binding protein (PBP1-ABC) superfamily)